VVAIFTKFDDLITQIYDDDLEEDENRKVAECELEKKFRKPLFGYRFPPRAHVCMEDLQNDDGNHQTQVKELMEKTAGSLDDLALKILFVSVQQNNLELCLRYAVEQLSFNESDTMVTMVSSCLIWFRHSYWTVSRRKIVQANYLN